MISAQSYLKAITIFSNIFHKFCFCFVLIEAIYTQVAQVVETKRDDN
jgi:hypothetical protein